MKANESQLKYFLNYSPVENDVFIRAKAVLWFKNEFLSYWKGVDERRESNFIQILNELYLSENNNSLGSIAKKLGIHVRTLNRYRDKFLRKMEELIEEFSRRKR